MSDRAAPLVLASASPRRLDLLAQARIVPDHVRPADIDESPKKDETPTALAERLSLMLIDRRRTDAMGEAGRAFALEAFNLQKQSRKLETYLMDLAGKAGTL